jgi:hypothetical protein
MNAADLPLESGKKMWNEAGDSEELYNEALRGLSEAEAKISSAGETVKAH